LKTKNEAAFAGADLYVGSAVLTDPTLAQAADVVGSTVSAVWWAVHRQKYRREILSGLLPLVPSSHTEKNLPDVPMTADDAALFDIIIKHGVDHVLAIAAIADAKVRNGS
jgi:hypothetical protein